MMVWHKCESRTLPQVFFFKLLNTCWFQKTDRQRDSKFKTLRAAVTVKQMENSRKRFWKCPSPEATYQFIFSAFIEYGVVCQQTTEGFCVPAVHHFSHFTIWNQTRETGLEFFSVVYFKPSENKNSCCLSRG